MRASRRISFVAALLVLVLVLMLHVCFIYVPFYVFPSCLLLCHAFLLHLWPPSFLRPILILFRLSKFPAVVSQRVFFFLRLLFVLLPHHSLIQLLSLLSFSMQIALPLYCIQKAANCFIYPPIPTIRLKKHTHFSILCAR